MLPQMKGLKVCSNHDESVTIGRVLDAKVTPQGAFEVDFELDLEENIVHDLIEQKLFTGLSLSHCLNSCRPVEVSVCWEGAREGTGIYTDSTNQANLQEYIVEQPEEVIIRASITEANRIFTMNTAADDQKTPEAERAQMAAMEAHTAEMTAKQNSDQQQQQSTNTEQQQQTKSAEDDASKDVPILKNPALHKLFQGKGLSTDDKNHIGMAVLRLLKENKKMETKHQELATQLEAEREKSKKIKDGNRVSANAIVGALKDLGVRIPNAKTSEMEMAIDNTPLFTEGGMGELIVQCSREKQQQQQDALQHAQNLDPGQKAALDLYQQFLSLQDTGSVQPDPLVRASASHHSGTKRSFASAMQPSSHNVTVTGNRSSHFPGMTNELANLLDIAPSSQDEYQRLFCSEGVSKRPAF